MSDIGPVPPPDPPTATVTDLLAELSAGREGALERLIPVVYDELRALAASYLRRDPATPTLQPTVLVHELYFKLVDQRRATFQNRAHFFGTAALLMRRLIVDHVRAAAAAKRGGNVQIPLDDAPNAQITASPDILRVNDALDALAARDPRQAKVVECRFFGGLTNEETAEVLGISAATVKREWVMARAWLHAELRE